MYELWISMSNHSGYTCTKVQMKFNIHVHVYKDIF